MDSLSAHCTSKREIRLYFDRVNLKSGAGLISLNKSTNTTILWHHKSKRVLPRTQDARIRSIAVGFIFAAGVDEHKGPELRSALSSASMWLLTAARLLGNKADRCNKLDTRTGNDTALLSNIKVPCQPD